MDRLGSLSRKLFLAVLCLPAIGWASYQPISGSSVTVTQSLGTNLQVQVNASTMTISAIQGAVTVNTHAITGNVGLVAGASLTNSTFTIVGSTVGIVLGAGTNFPVQVNLSTVGVVLGGGSSLPTNIIASTVAVVGLSGGNIPVQVNVSTMGVVQVGSWNLTNSTVGVVGILSDNGTLAGTNRLATLPAIVISSRAVTLDGTALTSGRNAAMRLGNSGLAQMGLKPDISGYSYMASTNTITVAAAATDIAALCGNANNTVLVYGIRASCTQTTAGTVNLTIKKRSTTAYTGAFSTMTATPMDSNYTVVQSSAIWFTANPTPGTLVGDIDNYKLGCIATATATPNDIYISPASWRTKPIVLRGATQCVALNLEAQTVTGGAFTTTFEWIEDPSL
jgi:hypothetical protein